MILDDWKGAAADFPANPFYEKVVPFLPSNAKVLDAGAGHGSGSEFLIKQEFEVTALEPDPELYAKLVERGIPAIRGQFADAPLADFDAVLTVFSFFFVPRTSWDNSWNRLGDALKPGGIWGGQLLGLRDEWGGTEPVTTCSREEIEQMLAGWQILDWEEVERAGRTAWGSEKMWHIHHIIARKADRRTPA